MPDVSPKRARGRPSKQNSEDLRAKILDGAIMLFVERGFENVAIKDIARLVGVATSLIHHHFANREGLRNSCRTYIIAEIRKTLEQFNAISDELSPEKTLEIYGATLRQYLGGRTHLLRFLVMTFVDGHPDSKALFRDYFGLFHQITLRFHEAGTLRLDIDPKWITMQAIYMQLGTAYLFDPLHSLLGQDPYDPEISKERTEAFIAIAKSGIERSE